MAGLQIPPSGLYSVPNVSFHLCAATPLPSHYSLYTSEIIGLEGQQQPAQGNALGTMVVCYKRPTRLIGFFFGKKLE